MWGSQYDQRRNKSRKEDNWFINISKLSLQTIRLHYDWWFYINYTYNTAYKISLANTCTSSIILNTSTAEDECFCWCDSGSHFCMQREQESGRNLNSYAQEYKHRLTK